LSCALSQQLRLVGLQPGLHMQLQPHQVLQGLGLPRSEIFLVWRFDDPDEDRAWAAEFVRWNNHDHRHSGIRYVSPAQRHAGEDHATLAARHALYMRAREAKPARWSGSARDGSPLGSVTLNPEWDSVVTANIPVADVALLAA